MNLLRKLETFLGCIGISSSLVLASLPPAKAQATPETPTCADPANETPLTKARLNQLYAGISNPTQKTPELQFESFAINSITPSNGLLRGESFRSEAREAMTTKDGQNPSLVVVPDGVVDLTVVDFFLKVIPTGVTNYPKSIFYDAKAYAQSSGSASIPLDTNNWQVLGFLDALNGTSAGLSTNKNAIPAMVFITTVDSDPINSDTVMRATNRNIGFFHAIVCESKSQPGVLRVGQLAIKNPQIYINANVVPAKSAYGFPGKPGRL